MTPKNTLLIFSVESKSAFNIVELQTAQTKGGKKTQIWELYSLHSQLCLLNRNPKYKLSIILCLYRREGRLMSASRQRHSFRKSSDSACRGDLITAQHHVT